MEFSVRHLEGEQDASTLRRLYDTVIVPSFPPGERETLEKLSRVLAADELHGVIAVAPDGEPVGALFLEWFADIRAGLLCYFAIRPGLRGQGVGRQLVAFAAPRWRAALRPYVVFAEAENPGLVDGRRPTGRDDYGDDHARLRLYAGFGARRVPIHYLQPELAPGLGRLANLLLLVAEADDVVCPAQARIHGAVVENFLERYFARTEGSAPDEDDSQWEQLRKECRAAEYLPLEPL